MKAGLAVFGNLYAYCTDFIINLSQLFHISYYEMNFILFIILFPLALAASMLYYFVQAGRIIILKKIKTTPLLKR